MEASLAAGPPEGFANLENLEPKNNLVGVEKGLRDIIHMLSPFDWEAEFGLGFTSDGVNLNSGN